MDLGTAALVIVDVQRDFCPGGSLGIPDADSIVVPRMNRAIDVFRTLRRPIVTTQDWHPPHSIHFDVNGGPHAVHCVAGTFGAEFHPALAVPADATLIHKGIHADEHAYSGFAGYDSRGRLLDAALRALEVDSLLVGGLALGGCVRATVIDGLKHGYRVALLSDATHGRGDPTGRIEEMRAAGAVILTTEALIETGTASPGSAASPRRVNGG